MIEEIKGSTVLYRMLLGISLVSTLGGLLTLIPSPGASYPNILGYRSLCTFAPAATLFCFLIAGISCFVRSTWVKDGYKTFREGLQSHRRSLLPLVFLLLLALGSTYWFSAVKSQYPDGGSSASVTAE